MPLKTNATVTTEGAFTTTRVGFATDHAAGATNVRVPRHVAQMLEDLGAVTVTDPGDHR